MKHIKPIRVYVCVFVNQWIAQTQAIEWIEATLSSGIFFHETEKQTNKHKKWHDWKTVNGFFTWDFYWRNSNSNGKMKKKLNDLCTEIHIYIFEKNVRSPLLFFSSLLFLLFTLFALMCNICAKCKGIAAVVLSCEEMRWDERRARERERASWMRSRTFASFPFSSSFFSGKKKIFCWIFKIYMWKAFRKIKKKKPNPKEK